MLKNKITILTIFALSLTACGDKKEESPKTAEQSSIEAPKALTAEEVAAQQKAIQEAAQKAKAAAKAKAEEAYKKAQEAHKNGNFETAFKFATQAADDGNLPQAQFLLGSLYYNGKGVEKNKIEAYKWLTLADIYKIDGTRKLMSNLYRTTSKEERTQVNAMVKQYLDSHPQ